MAKEAHLRGKIKEPPAPEVMQYLIAPGISDTEVRRGFKHYVLANKAHVLMLAKQKIISKDVAKKILKVTDDMGKMGDMPTFAMRTDLEEIYFNLENYLITRTSLEVGGQQHTARSRNDLHAVADRLVVREAYFGVCKAFIEMRETLIALAKKNTDAVMSGYTHLQPSEPITFAHYLSAVLAAFDRDYARLEEAYKRININPLGGTSMGSTTWDIDRKFTTRMMGFDGMVENSIDCVASRDYMLEMAADLAMFAYTMSKIAMDLWIWSTPEYGYIEVRDAVAACSSIMPQKKNPWTFESLRSMAARIKGHSDAVWMTGKNVPYTFTVEAADHQTPFWPCVEEAVASMKILQATVTGMKVKKDVMLRKAASNFCTVTELANFLVRIDKFSFRAAHEIVADVVEYMLKHSLKADDIDASVLNKITQKLFKRNSKMTDKDVKDALDPARSVQLRKVEGGSAPAEVKRQLAVLEASLKANKKVLASRERAVARAVAACDAQAAKFIK